jgi:predicted TIM-barrel fold metal-dependent hydrolase
MRYKVISTDNHINEPPSMYVDRLPDDLKDRAPRIMPGNDGGDGWSYDGKPPKTTFGLGATGAITKQRYEHYKLSGLKWEEIPIGNYDGAAHIKENELDGVDAASIYPAAIGTAYLLPDRELALACVRAYNDWLIDDFCSVSPDRLFSLAFMPVDDGVETAVSEAERVIAKGAKGLYLPLPYEFGYHHPMYDPLWKVASEAHVPVTIHRPGGTGVSRKELPASWGGQNASIYLAPGLNLVGIVQKFFCAINPISNMIFTGVFERFPELVFIAAEVNCGWVPELAQQMDQEFERQRHWAHPPFETQPSLFLGENVFVTMLDDYVGARFAKDDPATARTAMFSTDYPHSVTLWPNSREIIAKLTDGMDEDTKHNILAGNAIRAFSLK